jgi:hypothetical protein
MPLLIPGSVFEIIAKKIKLMKGGQDDKFKRCSKCFYTL